MAKFVKAWKERASMMALLVQEASEADSASAMEYDAAVCIQSWFRGCRVRAYYAHLWTQANIIQRNFRGYLGREEYRRRLELSLDEMRTSHYRDMATKIQRNWRGYYVRKYVFNYRTYKEYLKGVMLINEVVRSRTKEEKERVEREKALREEELHELQQQDQARRHHYLLSTVIKGGVFRPDPTGPPHPFEERMRSIRFAPPPGQRLRRRSRTKSFDRPYRKSDTLEAPLPATAPCGGVVPAREGYLPPLVRVQGPFKPPEEVQRLKHRPPKPTLRVAALYESENLKRIELKQQEWCRRVHDAEFLPFARSRYTNPPPIIHASSPYRGYPLYCTEPLRPTQPEKDISSKPFQTIIPTIKTFDELNAT